MDAATLQPAAGAQGELTGLLMIRAYLESKGNARKKVLIPDSAHGTNPASVIIAGIRSAEHQVERARANRYRCICAEFCTGDVAALMLTNPNTLGVFEERIEEIAAILHERGALLCMDGANMNALAGVVRPGRFRRGRDAPQLTQDVLHSPRRRRSRFGSRAGEEIPGALPADTGGTA